eukprot:CAMPEP_0204511542 /NCGR_PEP_ID=MMETSP0661-20131031/481_1 /ASSEMBLY_ACC=CAM_ASM_000606 /TAXON_ID=109239 /ORGANISM="Alexandrium margalefi, Strain AMGDE01CS-322" /LENGTH=157 /DNA_ID=CAMNT_0051516629 /DNA_START=404 /DNA_END=875 /DNA_ORIENTATION=-
MLLNTDSSTANWMAWHNHSPVGVILDPMKVGQQLLPNAKGSAIPQPARVKRTTHVGVIRPPAPALPLMSDGKAASFPVALSSGVHHSPWRHSSDFSSAVTSEGHPAEVICRYRLPEELAEVQRGLAYQAKDTDHLEILRSAITLGLMLQLRMKNRKV